MSRATSPMPERRRLIGTLVLLLGLGLASLPLFSHVPREQTLVFRIQNRTVTRLEASFTQPGDTTPLGAVTLRFPDRAPRSVRHQVSLPNGEYLIAVEVESAERPGVELLQLAPSPTRPETSWVRRVSLQGGETVIPL